MVIPIGSHFEGYGARIILKSGVLERYRIAIEGRFDAGFLTLCYAEPYLIFG
jgi:hypothetical protein